MSVRLVLAVTGAALLGMFGLAAPAAAHVSAAAGDTGSGRLGSTVALVVGLIGMVLGGLALARPAGRKAMVALVVGLIGMVLGVLALATSTDGVGTGNGRGGAIGAMVVGLIGMVLGGLALARSRRTG